VGAKRVNVPPWEDAAKRTIDRSPQSAVSVSTFFILTTIRTAKLVARCVNTRFLTELCLELAAELIFAGFIR